MFDYIYNRNFVNNEWTINNLRDVDANGDSVTLAQRVLDGFPSRISRVYLNPTQAIVSFTNELPPAEITQLTNIVTTHEDARGTINQSDVMILQSPNGAFWKVWIADTGNWVTELLT